MAVTAQDVAAALVSRLGSATAWQLQKLIYYCQAWHLARHDTPLFADRIEAWPDGPVVYDVFREHRGKVAVHATSGDPSRLDGDAQRIVDFVIETYGSLTARELVDTTHIEGPYLVARRGLPPRAPSNNAIDTSLMSAYYRRLDTDPAVAVDHAIHSAALEGIDTDFEDYLVLVDVARGELDEDTAVADLVSMWSARGND